MAKVGKSCLPKGGKVEWLFHYINSLVIFYLLTTITYSVIAELVFSNFYTCIIKVSHLIKGYFNINRCSNFL